MGDDLGSDDEYLTGNLVGNDDSDVYDFTAKSANDKSVLKASTVATLDDDDDDDVEGRTNSKRKRKQNTSEQEDQAEEQTKKAKNTPSRNKVLIEASRNIEHDPAQKQAAFLWTTLVHHHQLQAGKEGEELEDTTTLQPKLQGFHFVSSQGPTMESRLRDCMPSKKQLKTWKHRQSPCVIIVCLSARRAVQVLKELTSYKVRAAKLFAKHLQVSEQQQWLRDTPFPIAVGTPHRLQVLCEKGALNLKETKMVILDAHKDSKSFTVCTLPDTAPHCSEFLREQVLPAIMARPKELKLAFC